METNIQTLALDFINTKSPKSFNRLYDRLLIGIRIYVKKMIYDQDIVDDVVANVFAKAYISIDQYDPEQGHYTTWIYRIARNECFNQLARMKKTDSLDNLLDNNIPFSEISRSFISTTPDTDMDPDTYDFDKHYQDTLKAIDSLPDYYRDVFIDHYINGLDHKTIALKYDIPETTSKTRAFNSKTHIKRMMTGDNTRFMPNGAKKRVSK